MAMDTGFQSSLLDLTIKLHVVETTPSQSVQDLLLEVKVIINIIHFSCFLYPDIMVIWPELASRVQNDHYLWRNVPSYPYLLGPALLSSGREISSPQ